MFKGVMAVVVVALVLTMFGAGMAAAFTIEEVEAMVAELTETDCYPPELCMLYLEYKQEKIEVVSYTVAAGDTLINIANSFGVSLATIIESNEIKNPNLILVGQQLKFPAVTGLLYTVSPGDDLIALAEMYEVELEAIWFANSLDCEELEPGTELVIPGAKMPEPIISSASFSRGGTRVNYGLIWPLIGKLTSPYGMRRGSFHKGIDISGKPGTPIFAAATGIVCKAGWGGTYGYMIQLQHESGLSTLYAHASKLNVAPGDRVCQGDIIAYVGTTGRSTGPHLHFEVRVNGKNLNPLFCLP